MPLNQYNGFLPIITHRVTSCLIQWLKTFHTTYALYIFKSLDNTLPHQKHLRTSKHHQKLHQWTRSGETKWVTPNPNRGSEHQTSETSFVNWAWNDKKTGIPLAIQKKHGCYQLQQASWNCGPDFLQTRFFFLNQTSEMNSVFCAPDKHYIKVAHSESYIPEV